MAVVSLFFFCGKKTLKKSRVCFYAFGPTQLANFDSPILAVFVSGWANIGTTIWANIGTSILAVTRLPIVSTYFGTITANQRFNLSTISGDTGPVLVARKTESHHSEYVARFKVTFLFSPRRRYIKQFLIRQYFFVQVVESALLFSSVAFKSMLLIFHFSL